MSRNDPAEQPELIDPWSYVAPGRKWLRPESDLGNAHRLLYHASEQLAWDHQQGWQVFAHGVRRKNHVGARCVAQRLAEWVQAEADALSDYCAAFPADRRIAEACERRLAWVQECNEGARVEEALRQAQGLFQLPDWWEMGESEVVEYPSSVREQLLAAALWVVQREREMVCSAEGNIVAERVVNRVLAWRKKFWGDAFPMSETTMKRSVSAALGAKYRGFLGFERARMS